MSPSEVWIITRSSLRVAPSAPELRGLKPEVTPIHLMQRPRDVAPYAPELRGLKLTTSSTGAVGGTAGRTLCPGAEGIETRVNRDTLRLMLVLCRTLCPGAEGIETSLGFGTTTSGTWPFRTLCPGAEGWKSV